MDGWMDDKHEEMFIVSLAGIWQ